jgi:hypothetical protein
MPDIAPPLSEATVLRTQRNNLLARVLDLEVEVALLQDELQRLRRGPEAPARLVPRDTVGLM